MEFAKRWVHKGIEVTGFSIAGLGQTWKRYPLLLNFLSTQHDHGWSVTEERLPGLISAIVSHFGKVEQSTRVVKLAMVFGAVARIKDDPANQVVYDKLAEVLANYFGLDASKRALPQGSKPLWEIMKMIVLEAYKRLFERDLGRFNSDVRRVNKYPKGLLEKFPSLDVQSYRSVSRRFSPMVVTRNRMVLECAGILSKDFGKSYVVKTHDENFLTTGTSYLGVKPNEVSQNSYLTAGVAKYFVTKGVFSLRKAYSLLLNDS